MEALTLENREGRTVVEINRFSGKGKVVAVPIQLNRFSLKSWSSAFLLKGKGVKEGLGGGLEKVEKL